MNLAIEVMETIMFGLCIALAVIWQATLEIVQIIGLFLGLVVRYLWEHRELYKGWLRTVEEAIIEEVCQLCQVFAKLLAKLPVVNKKAAAFVIRLIPVIVGLAMLM